MDNKQAWKVEIVPPQKNSPTCWWEYKLVEPLWRMIQKFLKILKTDLSYDPVIPVPGIHPKVMKSAHQGDAPACPLLLPYYSQELR
jgi:hypothetical protein